MTKTSRWAGYITSLLAIANFVVTVELVASRYQSFGLVEVSGLLLWAMAISGVICLVSAIFGYFRQRGK